MVSWGIIASCMMFVTGEYSFYTIRVFLGAAEAGFFPGIIYYLTLWFPGVYRARVTGLFMACIPLSAAIGSPLSTSLLYLDGILGLRGWQWLFLLEGIPSVVLGVATFFYLTERPRDATGWLEQDERNWLDARMTAEHDRKQAELSLGMWQTLINPRVLVLSLVAYCLASITLGVGFFLPLIVKGFGLTNMQTGLVAIIPPAFGAAGMIWWGRKSDRAMERKYHLVAAMALAAIGIAAAAFVDEPVGEDGVLNSLSDWGVLVFTGVLDPGAEFPDRAVCRRGHRLYQLRRGPRRVRGALADRPAQGRHRQLLIWVADARRVGGGGRFAGPEHQA